MDKLNTLLKSLIKYIGLEDTKKINFKIVDNLIFFNYKGEKYKYYEKQCKIFKLTGKKYTRINWKKFTGNNANESDMSAENLNPDEQKQNSGRSPPLLLI